MLVNNKSPYTYFLKNSEYPVPAGASLRVDDEDWASDDELARTIESLDNFNVVFVTETPENYPRTTEFPLELNLFGGSVPWRSVGTYRYFDTIYPFVTADSGTFTLTANGQTTEPIAFDADLPTMLEALQALSGIGVEGVSIDGGPGNLGFALGLLTAPVTADSSGLVGVGASVDITLGDRIVELFTLPEGDILDNVFCQRITSFSSPEAHQRARLTDDPTGVSPSIVHWSAPFKGSSPSGRAWDIGSTQEFATLTGTGGENSNDRDGGRQVSYADDADVNEWYVTLPVRAKADSPIYLYVYSDVGDWSGTTEGEIEILVSTYTPA